MILRAEAGRPIQAARRPGAPAAAAAAVGQGCAPGPGASRRGVRPRLHAPLVRRVLARAVRPMARVLGQDALMHVPVVGVVELPPPGGSGPPLLMADDGHDRIASMLFWRGMDGWEPATASALLRLVAPGSTVVDVGANSGLFSLVAAGRDPTVRVHAVEPVARVFGRLVDNVALNRLANITCHRLACSDSAGTATMHVPLDEPVPVMASLLAGWCEGQDTLEPVECVTLDGLMEATGTRRVDVIKVDAEGAEDAVLQGASRTLAADHPFVFAEVLSRSGQGAAIAATLGDRGYRAFSLGPDGPRPCLGVPGGIDADESHNYLFAHDSRVDELRGQLAGPAARGPPRSLHP